MGLNRIGGALGAGIGAVGGVLADTWKDYFVCDNKHNEKQRFFQKSCHKHKASYVD